jgi:MFS family permease
MPDNPAKRRGAFAITFATMSLLIFAISFAYDIVELDAPKLPTHLETGLRDAAVFFPGIFMAFGAGILVDRFGIKLSGVLAAGLATAGTLLSFVYARTDQTYAGMLIGRALFGMGMEPAAVVAVTALQLTSSRRRLGLTLALFAGFGRLGSLLVDSSPHWTTWRWVASIWEGLNNHLHTGRWVRLAPLWDELNSRLPWLAASLLLVVAFGAMVYFCFSATAKNEINSPDEDISISPGGFWPLVVVCTATYASVFAARAFGFTFLTDTGLTLPQASAYLLMTSAIPLLCSAPFGWVADKVRSILLVSGAVVLVVGFGLLYFANKNAYGVIGLGFAALPAAIWPSLKDCVEKSRLGFANGLITAIQNAGIASLLVLTGYCNDHFDAVQSNLSGYEPAHGLLFSAALLSLGCAILYVRLRSSALVDASTPRVRATHT